MILVAIGANLTSRQGVSPREANGNAIARLASIPGLHLAAASPPYRSAAHPPSAQPDYVNAAALLHGTIDPLALLALLHEIEADAGRERSLPNAARTLDLDLIGIDDLVVDTPSLQLPHPRLHLRRFVLMPLADIAPHWRHPILGKTVTDLLATLPEDGTRRLAPHPQSTATTPCPPHPHALHAPA